MAPALPVDNDPFADPITTVIQPNDAASDTLVVGRSASLTLGTDSLIVLGTHPTTLALLLI